jgi:hypothetical protein
VNLFRNGKYNCTIQGEEDVVRRIVVPDAPNVNLPDLLFPVVSQIVLTPPGPYTVAHGTELPVGMVVYGSDGENLGLAFGDIMVSTSDNDVLSFAFSPGGLVLIGIAPGTAQILVKRADMSIIRIPDPGITNGVIQVTVT